MEVSHAGIVDRRARPPKIAKIAYQTCGGEERIMTWKK